MIGRRNNGHQAAETVVQCDGRILIASRKRAVEHHVSVEQRANRVDQWVLLIIALHEDNGCLVFNPHRYTLEEGGMKKTDRAQLAFKHEADPKGILNPGKMIAWDDPDFNFESGRRWLFEGLHALGPAA